MSTEVFINKDLKKGVGPLTVLLLSLSLIGIAFPGSSFKGDLPGKPAFTEASSIWVDDDWTDPAKVPENLVYGENAFCSIGEAIGAAVPGDEILVEPGTYDSSVENFPIIIGTENVTIRSVEGPEKTLIVGPRFTTVFSIEAPHVTVDGFTIKFGGYGIVVHSDDTTVVNNVISLSEPGVTWLSSCGILMCGSCHDRIENNQFENCGMYIFGERGSEVTILGGKYAVGENVSYFDSHSIENNTVNGKPIYYYSGKTGVTVPSDAGEVILANCSGVRVENINFSNASVGVEVAHSDNVSISNCTFSNNSLFGIYLAYSDNCAIVNNTCDNNNHGIDIRNSNNNDVENNSCRSNEQGIFLSSSDNNAVANNLVSSNGNGIFFANSVGNAVENNIIDSNWHGIYFESSENNKVENNLCTSNRGDGIRLSYSANNALAGNTITSGGTGIFLDSSDNNAVENNVIDSNRWSGVYLIVSNSNDIARNSIKSNSSGVRVAKNSRNNSIQYNRIVGNAVGVLNETEQTIDARYNYWGTTDYDQVSGMMQGTIEYVPICDEEMNPVRYPWVRRR